MTNRPGDAKLLPTRTGYVLSFQDQLTWAGLLLALPANLCRYRIDLDIKLNTPTHAMSKGEGWGFGIGPCNYWNGKEPFGFALQYAFFQQGTSSSALNAGTFLQPDVNNGTPVTHSVDYDWHHWTVVVNEDKASYYLDYDSGHPIGTYRISGAAGLTASCRSSSIFLRVFNASVSFDEITVSSD